MSCIICDLSARRAPASFVYESDEVFAVMTLEQPNPYKVMVCPRAHVEAAYDLTDAQAASVRFVMPLNATASTWFNRTGAQLARMCRIFIFT